MVSPRFTVRRFTVHGWPFGVTGARTVNRELSTL
jgi:hypothetical protein